MAYKFINVFIILSFVCTLVTPVPQAHAEGLLGLPEPGTMVNLSPAYEPMLIKGLKVHPENPFLFDFIIDTGNASEAKQSLEKESSKLIKYFLAAMTVPEKDLWVNLSPYERSRMIASNLAQTEMGRDMLAQDYILKQLTASLIYPERNLGKTFWDEVYTKARQLYGTTQVPVNTFNKVWIVADKADVYEHDNTAYVVGAHLKVMLEQDYLAMQKHVDVGEIRGQDPGINRLGSQIVRSIILPQIEKEVNSGRNFAPLRQMFYSMILASWYKMALKDAILTQIYGNQSKVKVGINQPDPGINQEIFSRYLRAYKKGVFNYIKEDLDKSNGETIPRKYFSGGTNFAMLAEGGVLKRINDFARMPLGDSLLATSGKLWDAAITVDPAQAAQQHPNHLKIVVWRSKKENSQGIPEVRYTRVSTLTVGPDEEKAFLKGIVDNKNMVLLTEETVMWAKRGNVEIRLSDDMGFIPRKYLGKKVVLSGNIVETLEGFQASPDDLPKKLKESPEIALRVNEVFRVKVHDRKNDRYLYFFPFNQKDLDRGELRLSALGGGVQFLRGGFDYYRKNIDPKITIAPGEDPQDVRVIIQGNKLDKMLNELNKGNYIEKDGDRELIEELNGENGLFPNGVPKQWLSNAGTADPAMRVAVIPDGDSTKIEMLIPDDAAFDPKTSALIGKIKGLAVDFAMTNDGKGYQHLTFRVKERWEKIKPFLAFMPWERHSAKLLIGGTIVFTPIALFAQIPERAVSVVDMVVVTWILLLELLERQEKRFMSDHDYYVKVLKSFYEKGLFSNGHSSREVVGFYTRNYQDFEKDLDDDQEEQTLELLAGTLSKEEIDALKGKEVKVKFEQRLLWALDKRDDKKAEFMKVHQIYLNALNPDAREAKPLPKGFVMKALQFYNRNNIQFNYFLTKKEQAEIAELLAKVLPNAQKSRILALGQNQLTVIEGLMYWDLESETAEKIDAVPQRATANAAMSVQASANNGGIDFNSRNMQMGIRKDGPGLEMRFDPATIERIKTDGFDGLEFRIISIVPLTNILN